MFDMSEVKMLPKNRKQGLTLPKEPSEDLAYFCGLLAGDGSIGIRLKKNDYYVRLDGNPADEKELYHIVVVPLVKKLFNLDVQPRTAQRTYGIRIGSKALIVYLTDVLGLPKNRKYNQLKIPGWVKENKQLVISYIRGLADTDFCLSLKKRYKSAPYYPVVSGSSESKKFMEEIATELELLGLKVSRHYDVFQADERVPKGHTITHRVHIYGHSQLIKWMQIIGFSSPKHLNKFNLWRERNVNSKRHKTISAIAESNKKDLATRARPEHIARGGFEYGNKATKPLFPPISRL